MATCPAGNVFSQHVHLINLTRSLVAARFLAIEVVAFGEVEGHNEAGHVHYLSLQPALDEILNLETHTSRSSWIHTFSGTVERVILPAAAPTSVYTPTHRDLWVDRIAAARWGW